MKRVDDKRKAIIEALQASVFIILWTIAWFLCGLTSGARAGLEAGKQLTQQEAINSGYMQYNQYTGEVEWTCKCPNNEVINKDHESHE